MDEFDLVGRLVPSDSGKSKNGKKFSYTAFLPDRRIRSDRRYGIPLYLVELEEDEISSLFGLTDDR